MEYKNIGDYIKKNMNMHGDFVLTSTDMSEKEEGMILVTIHQNGKDGDTADFLVRKDGSEEYTTVV